MTQDTFNFEPTAPRGRICECCGQSIAKLNPHRIDRQKARMLAALHMADGWVKIRPDTFPGFGADCQVHVMRLMWFGLVEHSPDHRSGLYRITQRGVEFLRGELAVPRVIWCRKGEVIDRSTETVILSEVKKLHLDKDYWDRYHLLQRSPPRPFFPPPSPEGPPHVST